MEPVDELVIKHALEPFGAFAKFSISFSFSNIRFENSDGSKVDGEPRINGSQVTYVPKKALKPFTSYAFVIPSGSLRNQWGGENTENYRFTFTTGDLESLQLECFHNREVFPHCFHQLSHTALFPRRHGLHP
jgi:hypothetical protein